tara:strand:+ start:1483 stop:1761 length:279 start_codon:yes stop_codon:yes gene_type:complete
MRVTKGKDADWHTHFTIPHGKWRRCTNGLNGLQAMIAERDHRKRGRKTQIRGPFKNGTFQVWAYIVKHKEWVRLSTAEECKAKGVTPGPGNK